MENIKNILSKAASAANSAAKWCTDNLSFVLIIAVVVLSILLARQCNRVAEYKSEKDRLENNLAAVQDSLYNYQKDGYNYAQMLALQLKLSELADSLKMTDGNTPVTITQFITQVKDTVFLAGEVRHDTVFAPMFSSDMGVLMVERHDRFGNSSRDISVFSPYVVSASDGKVYMSDSVEVIIGQNIWLESTLYKGKDKRTYMQVRSDYPSTSFNNGQGILVTNGDEYTFQARKRFGVGFGIQAGYGIGLHNNQPVFTPYIGLGASLNWNPKRLQF